MRDILRAVNRNLIHRLEVMGAAIRTAPAHPRAALEGLLRPYRDGLTRVVNHHLGRVNYDLEDLELAGAGDDLAALLSSTQDNTSNIDAIDSTWMRPLVRGLPTDQLSLAVVHWLYAKRRETAGIPFAVSEGGFGVIPVQFPLRQDPLGPQGMAVYFLPFTHQRGLLYLSLFGHEYGHVLYYVFTEAMRKRLVDFQDNVRTVLGHARPALTREQREVIIRSWVAWMQELFCDAVGVRLFGPAFIRAFSWFFLTRSRSDVFTAGVGDDGEQSHPSTRLRIDLLVETAVALSRRAKTAVGQERWAGVATDVRKDWNELTAPNADQPLWSGAAFRKDLNVALDEMLGVAGFDDCSPDALVGPQTAGEAVAAGAVDWCDEANRAWEQHLHLPAEQYWPWQRARIEALLPTGEQDVSP